jgi:small subunit ribosomal protein S18
MHMPPSRHQQQKGPPPGKRACPFCKAKKHRPWIDYKDYPLLKKYTNYFGAIKKRYYTGVCLRHQKMLTLAVERARFMGIIAYRK